MNLNEFRRRRRLNVKEAGIGTSAYLAPALAVGMKQLSIRPVRG